MNRQQTYNLIQYCQKNGIISNHTYTKKIEYDLNLYLVKHNNKYYYIPNIQNVWNIYSLQKIYDSEKELNLQYLIDNLELEPNSPSKNNIVFYEPGPDNIYYQYCSSILSIKTFRSNHNLVIYSSSSSLLKKYKRLYRLITNETVQTK